MILGRLERRDCSLMVEKIWNDEDITKELRDHIAEHTDGVPLFVEEITRSVVEAGEQENRTIAIPSTLQDSLEARLDRLGSAKEIAQIGAVIGREFGHGLLAQLAAMAAPDLDEALSRLVQSGLVFRHGQPPNATYTFKHALVQDTAYASLLRGRRRELHGRVADVLERQFPETVPAEPDLLFHHCAEAGRVVNAARYALTAADVAVGRASWVEADAQLAAALEIVTTIAHSRERDALELDLQVARTWTVRPLYSPAHERHEAILLRARELCDDVGNHDQMSQILFGLCIMHTWRANIGQALNDSRRLMQIAEDSQDRSQLLHANAVLGHALWHNGNNVDAERCFERTEAIYEPTIDLRQTHAPGLFHEQVHGAATRFTLGYPDRAVARAESAYASVSEKDERMTAMAVFQASAIRAWRGEPERVLPWIEQRLARWQETRNRVFLAAGNIFRSWALSRLGRIPDGPARIMEGIEQYNALNLRAWTPGFAVLLAELQIASSEAATALRTAEETLARIDDTDERQFESPALAVKGDAIRALTPSDVTAAGHCYGASIEVARAQSAKSWELRAATRLARLWHSQGKTTEGHDLLAPVYGWFTEGFDTADLKEAKALLDELN